MTFHTPRESYLWLKAFLNHRHNLHLTRGQLEAAQLKKFRKLVAYIEKRSPFYRAIIHERQIDLQECVPEDFPVLTKSEVMENFDELVTDRRITRRKIADFLVRSTDPLELFEGCYHVLHTSGTSGNMGLFVFSREAWIKGASHAVRVSSLRWRQRIAFVGATRGHFAGVSLILAGNDGGNRLFFDVRTFDVNQPMAELIAQLNGFAPHVLSGYGTVLKVLAQARERGELRIQPEQVGNGGEPLLPDMKAYLERVFRVPVRNGYASSEHLYMAITFPDGSGMHLLEDDLMFELQPDCTCVTNLFNPTMPLIRYRMDDVLLPDNRAGNPYPFNRVQEVVGRQEDALTFTNAFGEQDFIHPIVIVELAIPGLTAWQIVLESATSFRFRASYATDLDAGQRASTREAISRKLQSLLAEKNMLNVSYRIEEVKALAIDPLTGKFRLVLREAKTVSPGG